MQSERFTLNRDDVEKWLRNAMTFLAPALLLFLLEIQSGKTTKEALIALQLWALNTAIDLVRKWIANK